MLNRVLTLTPAGQRELAEPRAAMTLPQRWLLERVDGISSLATLGEASFDPTQVARLPQDAAKLVLMGMATMTAGAGPRNSPGGPVGDGADQSAAHVDHDATVLRAPDAGGPAKGSTVPAARPAMPAAIPAAIPEAMPAAMPAAIPADTNGSSTSVGEPGPAGAGTGAVTSGPGEVTPSRSRWPSVAIGGALTLAGLGAGYVLWSPRSAPEPVAGAAPSAVPAAASAAAVMAESPPKPAGADVVAALQPAAERAAPPTVPAPTTQKPGPAPAVVPNAPPLPTESPAAPLRALPATASAPLRSALPAAPGASRQTAPAPGPAPAPVLAPAPAPTVAVPAPASAAAVPLVPNTAPLVAAVPTPAAPIPAAPTPVAPAPPPAVQAAPAPTAPTVAVASAAPLRPLSSPAPSFPRDAINDSRREVLISARLSIAANGEVTRVEFTGTTPRDRAFERNARSALQSWRFPEGAADRSYSTTLVFKVE